MLSADEGYGKTSTLRSHHVVNSVWCTTHRMPWPSKGIRVTRSPIKCESKASQVIPVSDSLSELVFTQRLDTRSAAVISMSLIRVDAL
jgi:hypothetical protein